MMNRKPTLVVSYSVFLFFVTISYSWDNVIIFLFFFLAKTMLDKNKSTRVNNLGYLSTILAPREEEHSCV